MTTAPPALAPRAPVRLAMAGAGAGCGCGGAATIASDDAGDEGATTESNEEVEDNDAAMPAMLDSSAAFATNDGYVDSARPITSPWTDARPQDRSIASMKEVMLDRHAAVRRAVGLAPLGWSDALAADAARYAQVLAAANRFEHAHQSGEPEGENLWMGTRDAYEYREMVGGWSDEARVYRAGTFPNVSSTGNFGDVGHYTQLVWRGTTHVGCATASNRDNDYLVCRYYPAGNVMGDRAY